MTKKKNKTLLAVLAAMLIGVLLFAVAFEVGKARKEKSKYISAAERLALLDFAEAVNDMEKAADGGDVAALNRAAGKAEAYLSRAGIGDCGEVYGIIEEICAGECGADVCESLKNAVDKAIEGDGGEALRSLSKNEGVSEESSAETTDDMLSARLLERIGRGREDVAYSRAVSFACPNAVFEECGCDEGNVFKYSGENIFVSIGGESARVMMYCFDREVDDRYSVSEEEAERRAELIIKKEKLRLVGNPSTELRDGVYRTVYFGDGENADLPLVTIEIYSDTGRLRKYDAVNYYRIVR